MGLLDLRPERRLREFGKPFLDLLKERQVGDMGRSTNMAVHER